MPVTNYKVWAWGTPIGIGVTGAHHVGIAGVAKKASSNDPLIIVNEVVCNALARVLLLPCPPGATLDKSGETFFFSLDFNLVGAALPPIDPSAVSQRFPQLAWGIILFDSLVMNFDRHSQNIAHDTSTDRIEIFDHSHAFLHAGKSDIDVILSAADGELCIGNHCLAQEIVEEDGLSIWAKKISEIPDFYIEGVIDLATQVGLPATHKKVCADFLKKRKSGMEALAQKHIAQFPKLQRPKVIS